MTVFDFVLPMMVATAKSHLKRGHRNAERVVETLILEGYD
jgi:hypothetical protein